MSQLEANWDQIDEASSPLQTSSINARSYQVYITELSEAGMPSFALASLRSEVPNECDTMSVLLEFTTVLGKMGVPGPFLPILDRKYLGTGAQFTVYSQQIWAPADGDFDVGQAKVTFQSAALKIPNVILDSEKQIDLSSSKARRNVHDLLVEITVLSHPQLRQHPNIINLLGWGADTDTWQNMPFLALELAEKDLCHFLQGFETSIATRLQLCVDVALGLDAMHSIGLVHMDVKPANILIVSIGSGWTAKLSDFAGVADVSSRGLTDGRGTAGWRAPELRRFHAYGERLDLAVLERVDSYSYGLLIWSVLLGNTGTSSCDENTAAFPKALACLHQQRELLSSKLSSALESSFSLLLAEDPYQRVSKIAPLLNHNDQSDIETSVDPENPGTGKVKNRIYDFHWQTPDNDHLILQPLKLAFKNGGQLPSKFLFAIFLSHAKLVVFGEDPVRHTLPFLLSAAEAGHKPACAIIFRLYESFELEVPQAVERNRFAWISDAVSSGAFFLNAELKALDERIFEKSMQDFRSSGGYSQVYTTTPAENVSSVLEDLTSENSGYSSITGKVDEEANGLLHALSVSPNTAILSRLLQKAKTEDINAQNLRGETPLYLACMAGAAANAMLLLRHGAEPSIRPLDNGPSCLHWLFTFDSADIGMIAQQLMSQGASVDCLCVYELDFLHYPFKFPRGTPLHWAVETSNKEAIAVLLYYDASLSVRNGSDPYVYDQHLRIMTETCPLDDDSYSLPEYETAGYTAIDIAVLNHDNDALEILLGAATKVNLEDCDEEGYGAQHRLDVGIWRQNRNGTRIWSQLFRGNPKKQMKRVKRIVSTLARHGYNLEKLTNPKEPVQYKRSIYGTTPLMLAVANGNAFAVDALLQQGVDANALNPGLQSALHFISGPRDLTYDDEVVSLRIAKALFSRGSKVGKHTINGFTALLGAAMRNMRGVCQFLLDNGANPGDRVTAKRQSEYGKTALALMATGASPDDPISETGVKDEWYCMILRKCIPALADVNCKGEITLSHELIQNADLNGSTLLHYTAYNGLVGSCKLLLEAGVAVNSLKISKKRRGERMVITHLTPIDSALQSIEAKQTMLQHIYSRIGQCTI
ncbi:MAG: hypothetical protein M1814_003524 [Vezdaea aestivalis]|nr:MAG: hypothetical protein M1814_003524 [Vezdaea aestivalis]